MPEDRAFLCVSAHPDDMEFGCLGTALGQLRQGWRGHLVVVTTGQNGWKIEPRPPAERAAVRRREQEEVARRLGLAGVTFLGHRDGFLDDEETLRRQLVQELRRVRPHTVFAFDPANLRFDDLNLHHRDHRVVARAAFDACFLARNAWAYPGETHEVERILFFASAEPDHFVDVSELMPRKLELLACHASQFPDLARLERLLREEVNPPHPPFAHAESFRVLEIVRRI